MLKTKEAIEIMNRIPFPSVYETAEEYIRDRELFMMQAGTDEVDENIHSKLIRVCEELGDMVRQIY